MTVEDLQPSAELRGLELEILGTLTRIEGILVPVAPLMERVTELLEAEAVAAGISELGLDEWLAAWKRWHGVSGDDEVQGALERVSQLLRLVCPGCELP